MTLATPRPTGELWRRILVPTDLSDEAGLPFAHAVRLAVDTRGTVTALHASTPGVTPNWSSLPTAQDLLVRWGVLGAQDGRAAYQRLGMHVRMRADEGTDPVNAVASEVSRELTDLLVLGTEARSGLDRWFSASTSEPMARAAAVPALFLPRSTAGLFDVETGAPRLHHVLVPRPTGETQRETLVALDRLASALGVQRLQVTFLHVGEREELASLNLSQWPRWNFGTELREGPVVEAILQAAAEHRADLVVMGTHGHDSLGDMLQGSITERVIRRAPCPVLAVPLPRVMPPRASAVDGN